METNKKQLDFNLEESIEQTKKLNLFNNQVLVRVEARISKFQLNALVDSKGNDIMNNTTLRGYFEELAKADKIIVKISEEAKNKYPVLKLGDIVISSNFDNPQAWTNVDDPYDLDNVIEDFKFDNAKSNAMNGIKYKTHGYYLINANFINATISRE